MRFLYTAAELGYAVLAKTSSYDAWRIFRELRRTQWLDAGTLEALR